MCEFVCVCVSVCLCDLCVHTLPPDVCVCVLCVCAGSIPEPGDSHTAGFEAGRLIRVAKGEVCQAMENLQR